MMDEQDDPIIVRIAIVLFWLAWLGVLAVFWAWVVKWLG